MSSHDLRLSPGLHTDRDLSLLSFDETPPPPPPPPAPAPAPAPELTGRVKDQLCSEIIQLGKPAEVDTGRVGRVETNQDCNESLGGLSFQSVERKEGSSRLAGTKVLSKIFQH